MKKTFAQILAAQQAEPLERVLDKVPQWAGTELTIPSRLATEQCSSSATALYKAGLLKSCRSIADLTGGLGVDCWAFVQSAEKVYHNELNPELSEAVRANFSKLGLTNVEFSCQDAVERLESLPEIDAVYLDPARRDSAGKKVFMVEDCRPDVLSLMPSILRKAPLLLVKLSPMADITMLCEKFAPHLKELHIVSLKGEVKEILLLITRSECTTEPLLIATDLESRFEFRPSEEKGARAHYTDSDLTGRLLYEPDPAILKAGAFKLLSERFHIWKLAPSTHLYCTDRPVCFGRHYRILRVFESGKAGTKECAAAFPEAEVSSRNFPMSSDELRGRLKVSPSQYFHIFGVTLGSGKKVLVATSREDT